MTATAQEATRSQQARQIIPDVQGAPRDELLEVKRLVVKRFGETYDTDYDTLLARQGGVCAICGGIDRDRKLAVDHDHQTGLVRGLLCLRCNTGVGLLRDKPWQAIPYLLRSMPPGDMRSASKTFKRIEARARKRARFFAQLAALQEELAKHQIGFRLIETVQSGKD